MSEPNLRDELLKHDPAPIPPTVEAELKTLRQLIEQDRTSARRLMRWTIGVWVAWIVCLILSFGLYFSLGRSDDAGNPAGLVTMIAGLTGFIAFLGTLFLPIIGIVLLIVALARRRWVSLAQIKLSLASIDAQLKTLAQAREPR